MNSKVALRCLRVVAPVGIAVLALAGLIIVANARSTGHWGALDFQVQNPWPVAMPFSVRLFGPNGDPIGGDAAGILAPYETRYFPALAPSTGLTGTLIITSAFPLPAAIMHLEELPYETGNTVYELRQDSDLSTTARLPWLEKAGEPGNQPDKKPSDPSGSSQICIDQSTANGPAGRNGTIRFFDRGSTTPFMSIPISRVGTHCFSLDAIADPRMPPGWSGSAIVTSSVPVHVEVLRTSAVAADSYTGMTERDAGTDLVLPWVAPAAAGEITSTLILFNPSTVVSAPVELSFAGGPVLLDEVPPADFLAVPVPEGVISATAVKVHAGQPILALARLVATDTLRSGTLTIAAFNVPNLTPHAAAPLLYNGYRQWTHAGPGAVRVYNAGTLTDTYTLSYRAVGAAEDVISTTLPIGPGAYVDSAPPSADPALQHWSLRVDGQQPVALVVIGFSAEAVPDRWFGYRGISYAPLFQVYLPGVLSH